MSTTILSDGMPIDRLSAIESLRSEWFWAVDAQGCFTYFSPSYAIITGFAPPVGESIFHIESRGQDVGALLGTLPPLPRLVESHAARETYRDVFHDTARTRVGGTLLLSSSWLPATDALGRLEGLMGVTRCRVGEAPAARCGEPERSSGDGTSGQVRDEAPFERESTGGSLLRTVLDTVPFTITVRDRKGNFRMVNRAFRTFYGLEESELIGRHVSDVRERLRVDPQATRPDSEILDGQVPESDRETFRTDARGERRALRAIRRPYVSESGEILGVVTVAVDVTDRKKAEQEAARYRDRLETLVEERTAQLVSAQASLVRRERLATLGQLTATVSHELRNPLATIGQSASRLRRHLSGTDHPLTPTLDRIDRSIHRCVRIIEQLLSFGQQHHETKTRRVVLDRWLAAVLDSYDWAAGITHSVDLAADVALDIDTTRMDQALTNLVTNACQAIRGDGAEASSGTVAVKTRVSGNRVEIVVCDTGPGIPEESRDLVFEPLFSTKTYGFGLGMPLVKQVAQDHGGDVEIAEADSGGAMVTLWLPLARRA